MLKLNLKAAPYTIDLPRGVTVEVLPASASLMEAVRSELFAGVTPPEEGEEPEAVRVSTLDWAKAMARHAIVGWDGVGDESGAAIEPSPDYIDALLEDDRIFIAWRDAYVLPALKVDDEGNG